MRALRHGIDRDDLLVFVMGGGLTLAVALITVQVGAKIGAGSVMVGAFFCVLVAGWLFAPHIVVALSIPVFAAIPAAKVLVTPWIGPLKDVVTLAAAVAIVVTVLQREKRLAHVDRVLLTLVAAFLGLYVVNIGGAISGGSHNIAWAQGVRLIGEPLILLTAGLLLGQGRRTLNLAVTSLIATGLGVALYGIYQQKVGRWNLVGMGYTFNEQVRTIGGHLRSFGSLDDPFAYAAFLLLALSAALFWMRPGPLKLACMSIISLGLILSFVRSALFISIALVAVWLISRGRTTLGLLLLGASAAAALALLFSVAGANETRSVQAAPSTYITLNGRTTVWSTVFDKPSKIPMGVGVGKVGTAAERAQFGVTADPEKARKSEIAVDSGYFATVADVGVVGLLVLLALYTRLVVLGIAGTKRPGTGRAGWLVLGWLIVLLIDAVTRASFTGFPTAFLGLLLVGVGIAASDRPPGAPSWR
jgi:O-antigen ligase/polysaccharide polymerase Wzy-like membrane protein